MWSVMGQQTAQAKKSLLTSVNIELTSVCIER